MGLVSDMKRQITDLIRYFPLHDYILLCSSPLYRHIVSVWLAAVSTNEHYIHGLDVLKRPKQSEEYLYYSASLYFCTLGKIGNVLWMDKHMFYLRILRTPESLVISFYRNGTSYEPSRLALFRRLFKVTLSEDLIHPRNLVYACI